MDLDLRSANVEESSILSEEQQRQRRLARYKGETVLLDPKNYGENPEDRTGEKIYTRIKQLAELLNTIDPDEKYILRCQGWFEAASTEQFYLVYSPPAYAQLPMQYITLHQYVGSTFKPSVTARIYLAYTLAKSIAHIHREGWLHKGIRSDHVLFFPERIGASRTIENPRLAGFDYARRDAPGEYSEKPMNTHANLYRHPDALRDPSTAFTKIHDYYSLGILLAEIAVWRKIRQILVRHQALQHEECQENDARKVRDILLNEDSEENHPREIAFRMGDIYRNVVNVCLTGQFGPNGSNILATFEQLVVKQLSRCLI